MIKFEDIISTIFVKELIPPLFIIGGGIIAYILGSKLIKRVFRINIIKTDRRKTKTLATLTTNVFKYFIILVCALMLLDQLGFDTKTLVASLGVVGVVAGLAMQDTLKDFVAGVFILTEDQYKVGDTVKISGFMGEVIYLGMKTTKIQAYTGEVKIISNRTIDSVINYSLDFSLAIVDLLVSYKEDIDKVTTYIEEINQELSNKLNDTIAPLELWGVDGLEDSGVRFRVVVKCLPMKHYAVQREMRKVLKNELEKRGIKITYPHMVIENEK